MPAKSQAQSQHTAVARRQADLSLPPAARKQPLAMLGSSRERGRGRPWPQTRRNEDGGPLFHDGTVPCRCQAEHTAVRCRSGPRPSAAPVKQGCCCGRSRLYKEQKPSVTQTQHPDSRLEYSRCHLLHLPIPPQLLDRPWPHLPARCAPCSTTDTAEEHGGSRCVR